MVRSASTNRLKGVLRRPLVESCLALKEQSAVRLRQVDWVDARYELCFLRGFLDAQSYLDNVEMVDGVKVCVEVMDREAGAISICHHSLKVISPVESVACSDTSSRC